MSKRSQSSLSLRDLELADNALEWTVVQAKKYKTFTGDRNSAAAVYERHSRRCASTTPRGSGKQMTRPLHSGGGTGTPGLGATRPHDGLPDLTDISAVASTAHDPSHEHSHGDVTFAEDDGASGADGNFRKRGAGTSTSSLTVARAHGTLPDKERLELRQKLEAKTILDPVFDEAFASRLRSVNRHNSKASLEQAMSVHDKLLLAHYVHNQQEVDAYEERRLRAEDLHRHAAEMARQAVLVQRMNLWSEVVVTVTMGAHLIYAMRKARALCVLKRTFLPMAVVRLKMLAQRRHRRFVTEQRLEQNIRPTGGLLAGIQGGLFQHWSTAELSSLAGLCKPISFLAGERIITEGDFDRIMYIVTRGTLTVFIRDRTSQSKRRCVQNSSAVFQLTAPCYIGEYALLCKEPRSATIECKTDTDAFCIDSDAFVSVLKQLNPEVAEKLEAATDERRRANLQKFFSYKIESIRRSPIFEMWSTTTLKELVKELQPVIVRRGFKLFAEGDYDPCLYFVSEGQLRMFKPSEPHEPPVQVNKYMCIGAFETFFMYERRTFSAYCESPCDLWKLSRSSMLNVGMGDPAALMQSRSYLQRERASLITKPVRAPSFVLGDPFLSFALPPAMVQQLWGAGQARVYCTGETICAEGEDARHVFVILVGSFTMVHQVRDHQRYDERIIVSPVLQGCYSSQSGSNAVLTSLFPVAAICDIPKTTVLRHAESSLPPRRSVIGSQFVGGAAGDQQAQERDATVGLTLGAYEVASRRGRYVQTIKCLTMCEVVVLDREAMEEKMPDTLKKLLTGTNTFVKYVTDCYLRGEVKKLLGPDSASLKVSTLFANLKQQEREKASEGGPVPEGGKLPPLGKRAVA